MFFRFIISPASYPRVLSPLTTLLISILVTGITGCATQPAPPESLPQEQINTLSDHQQRLDALQRWELKGRLAISFNSESWNATIHWQQHPQHYHIQLYLPLGQGSLQLKEDPNGATLETSSGEHFSADSGENLFYQQFGLIFPIGALHDWVIGRPSMGAGASSDWLQQIDRDGQMISLEQDEWNLRLLSYQQIALQGAAITPNTRDTLPLPGRVFVRQNGNSVRLVIQQWQIGELSD